MDDKQFKIVLARAFLVGALFLGFMWALANNYFGRFFSLGSLYALVARQEDELSRVTSRLQVAESLLKNLLGEVDPEEHPFVKKGLLQRELLTDSFQVIAPDVAGRFIEHKNATQCVSTIIDKKEVMYLFDTTLIRPEFIHSYAKKLLLLSVHGTNASNDSYGADPSLPKSQIIYRFAKQLSRLYECPVEIVSFGWSGSVKFVEREKAAQILADYVRSRCDSIMDPIDKIWTIAHSHGCNVVSMAAHVLRDKQPFDVAIHIACPASDIVFDRNSLSGHEGLWSENGVFNIRTIYHFYGLMDFTQSAGSFISGLSFDRKLPYQIGKDRMVYNVRLQQHGKDLNHITIFDVVMENLFPLVHAIDTAYGCYADLDANVYYGMYPMVTVRDPHICFPHRVLYERLERSLDKSTRQNERFSMCYSRSMQECSTETNSWLGRLLMPIAEYKAHTAYVDSTRTGDKPIH